MPEGLGPVLAIATGGLDVHTCVVRKGGGFGFRAGLGFRVAILGAPSWGPF